MASGAREGEIEYQGECERLGRVGSYACAKGRVCVEEGEGGWGTHLHDLAKQGVDRDRVVGLTGGSSRGEAAIGSVLELMRQCSRVGGMAGVAAIGSAKGDEVCRQELPERDVGSYDG